MLCLLQYSAPFMKTSIDGYETMEGCPVIPRAADGLNSEIPKAPRSHRLPWMGVWKLPWGFNAEL